MSMTVTEVRALKPGDLVRALIPVSGGVSLADGGEMEIELPAGAVATVIDVGRYGKPQGWGVSVSFDNGIDNLFDQGDADAFPLERAYGSDKLTVERLRFLLQHSPDDYPSDDLLGDLQYIVDGKAVR